MKVLTALLCALIVCASCGHDRQQRPKSNARPYDVVVVGDSAKVVERALEADMPGLPQPEPRFNVTSLGRGEWSGRWRYARAVVLFTGHGAPGERAVTYRVNVHAVPQIVITTTTEGIGETMRLLDIFERQTAAEEMHRKGNRRMEAMVDSMFSLKMVIPATFVASKRGSGFLWMSDNHATDMSNLCVMRLQGMPTAARVDSVLAANIKGETDDMWMQTVTASLRSDTIGSRTRYYGLWQMHGDAMGGPFAARVFPRSDGSTLVVLAFVYAPGKKKRNLMQRLNAVLYNKYINNGRQKD